MTALGKALTFFNVLFAIITGVLIVNAYITRTNWRNGMEAWQQEAKAAQAAAKAADAAANQKRIDLEEQRKKLDDQIAQLSKAILGKDEEIKAEKNRVKDHDIQRAKSDQVSQASTAEINRLQLERNQMADQLKTLNDQHAKVTKELADTTSQMTYYKLRSEAQEKDLVDLREKYATLLKNYEIVKAQLPAGNRGARENQPRAPSIETSGEVAGVSGNLARITLGNDNGIERGHILQVYRLGKTPNDAVYLGTLTIDRTSAHEAVGTFEPAGRGKTITAGDKVDTRILR
jgi:chromosome segregation ATPase